MLAAHGKNLKEETIVALRTVKDELSRIGGELNFTMSQGLRLSVHTAWRKYDADIAERKKLRAAESKRKADEAASAEKQQHKTNEIASIDIELEQTKGQLQAASEILESGNSKLQDALQNSKLDRKSLQSAQSKINIGIEMKRKAEDRIQQLRNKKLKLK